MRPHLPICHQNFNHYRQSFRINFDEINYRRHVDDEKVNLSLPFKASLELEYSERRGHSDITDPPSIFLIQPLSSAPQRQRVFHLVSFWSNWLWHVWLIGVFWLWPANSIDGPPRIAPFSSSAVPNNQICGLCVFGPERGGVVNRWLPKGHDVLVGSDTLFPGFRFTLSQQVVGVHGVQKAWL